MPSGRPDEALPLRCRVARHGTRRHLVRCALVCRGVCAASARGGGMGSARATKHGWALITGASSGIGYELAKQFGEHGFDLLVTGQHEGIHEAARDFERYGGKVEA